MKALTAPALPSLPGTMKPSRHVTGLLLVMAAATLWATTGVASRLDAGAAALPEEVHGFIRCAIAGPALLAAALLGRGHAAALLPARGAGRGFLVFGLCGAVFQISLFKSFALLGVTMTVFLTVCLPPVIAVMWPLTRGRGAPPANLIAAIGLAAAGLLSCAGGLVSQSGPAATAAGLALSTIASAAFVIMTGTARRLAEHCPPLVAAGAGLSMTALVLLPVAGLSLCLAGPAAATAALDAQSFLTMLYLGLGPTALAYVCFCSGMARCDSAAAGLVAAMIEPAVAVLLAVLLLGERLSPAEIAGCLLIFLAMAALSAPARKSGGAAVLRR